MTAQSPGNWVGPDTGRRTPSPWYRRSESSRALPCFRSREALRRAAGCRAVLEAHEHDDFRAERAAVKLHRFFTAAIEEMIGVNLHDVSFPVRCSLQGRSRARRWTGIYTVVYTTICAVGKPDRRCSAAGRQRWKCSYLSRARGQHIFKNTSSSNRFRWIPQPLCRLALAAWAPFLPSAVRVFLGSLVIVRLLLAAAAAFLILRRAASVCLVVAMKDPPRLRFAYLASQAGLVTTSELDSGRPRPDGCSRLASVRTILNSALRARRRVRHSNKIRGVAAVVASRWRMPWRGARR